MKRRTALFLLLAVLLMLTACGRSEKDQSIRTEEHDGTVYMIDPENGTISDGANTYSFTVQGNRFTVTYPDGSSFWWEQYETSGAGGWSDDYETRDPAYPDGDVLMDMVSAPQRAAAGVPSGPVLIVLFLVGLWGAVLPQSLWKFEHGWMYKDAEPSDLALAVNRGVGIVLILVAAVGYIAGG